MWRLRDGNYLPLNIFCGVKRLQTWNNQSFWVKPWWEKISIENEAKFKDAATNALTIYFTSPTDGSSLSQSPRELTIVFKSPVQLVRVDVQKVISNNSGSFLKELFNNVEGQKVTLENNFLYKKSTHHLIELPSLRIGIYDVEWRAIGQDGHIIKGKFTFTLLGK